MSLQLTTYYKGADLPDALLDVHPFHSKQLFLLYEKTKSYTPVMVTVSDDEQLLGQMLAVLRSNWRPFPPFYIRRCEVYDTGVYIPLSEYKKPVAHGLLEVHWHECLFDALLQELTQEASHQCFLIEFRNIHNGLFGYKHFKKENYFPHHWLRIVHHLDNWKEDISSSRFRSIVRARAGKARMRCINSSTEIPDIYKLLRIQMSARVVKQLPTPAFLVHFYHDFVATGKGEIYLVHYKDKLIGCSLAILWKGTSYLWFSVGHGRRFPFQFPNTMAIYAAIQDAWHRKFPLMEYVSVGASITHHHYTALVASFGGDQVSTRRWFRYRWGWLNRLLRFFYL